MQLDAILVYVTSEDDLRRLVRAGGEVWERGGRTTDARGRAVWAHGLVKLPAAVALRMGLVALGAELGEVATDATIAAGGGGPTMTPARQGRQGRRRASA